MKKKILFLIETLGGGGAERVLVNLVNAMDKSQFDITVMTVFDGGVNAKNLSEDIKYIELNSKKFSGIKTVFKFLPKKSLYRKYLKGYVNREKYDLIVAYMTGVPTFIAAGASAPKIAWLHGEFFKPHDFKSWLNIFGLKHIYNKFNYVAGVSEYTCERFKEVIKADVPSKVIYNTNDVKRIVSLSEEACRKNEKMTFVTVGCLEQTKGFDRLINVCRKLIDDGFVFQLNILGEGIERTSLENQITRLDLQSYVKLSGFQQNPYKYVKNSDLFICSSRTEGLSTAVSEAVILGTPVVSTDVSGAKEILGDNNEFGIVTENDEDSLYNGIKTVISDKELLSYYKDKAKERAVFFDEKNTVNQAESLFNDIINGMECK